MLRKFCSSMNFPPPVYPKSFNTYINHISKVAEEHCQDSMNMAAENLRKGDKLAEITVSVDGTWQKIYGHNSLLGASFVISIENGQVLDYVIRCKSCQICNRNPNASEEWKRKHKLLCKINHTNSSGAMEKEATVY